MQEKINAVTEQNNCLKDQKLQNIPRKTSAVQQRSKYNF